jgi:hypothetical protein
MGLEVLIWKTGKVALDVRNHGLEGVLEGLLDGPLGSELAKVKVQSRTAQKMKVSEARPVIQHLYSR